MTVATGVFLTGCSKFKTAGNTEETAPEPSEEKTATSAPAQAATPTPAPRLAAPGTFFLLRKKSVTTNDGIIGFKPGTLVTQKPDGSYVAEGRKLEVAPGDLTNNLDLAAQVAGQDALRQTTIRQAMAARAATPAPTATPTSRSAPAVATTTSSSSTTSTIATSSRSSNSEPAPNNNVIAGTQRVGSGLEASSSLGATHTKVQDGWLWQKTEEGGWRKVKPLR